MVKCAFLACGLLPWLCMVCWCLSWVVVASAVSWSASLGLGSLCCRRLYAHVVLLVCHRLRRYMVALFGAGCVWSLSGVWVGLRLCWLPWAWTRGLASGAHAVHRLFVLARTDGPASRVRVVCHPSVLAATDRPASRAHAVRHPLVVLLAVLCAVPHNPSSEAYGRRAVVEISVAFGKKTICLCTTCETPAVFPQAYAKAAKAQHLDCVTPRERATQPLEAVAKLLKQTL